MIKLLLVKSCACSPFKSMSWWQGGELPHSFFSTLKQRHVCGSGTEESN